MAKAEYKKLDLLRESRLSQEKFYYNLAILSGGTLSIIIGLINIMKDKVSNFGSCLTTLLQLSIGLMITSLISSWA